jgi:hypothetical protein
MMATEDDQLAALLTQFAALFPTLQNQSTAQILFLSGTTTDPDSFDANGGKTGPLGYYAVVNVSGQTIYMPSLARLTANLQVVKAEW